MNCGRISGFTWLVLLLLATFVAGCGSYTSGTANNPSLGANSKPGMAVFQSTFYSFANTRGCVKCHGSIVHPTFAAPDLGVAYAAATGTQIGSTAPLIDFNSPDASIIIQFAGNGHCADTPCSDPAVRPQVQSLLEAWAAAERSAGGGGGGVTAKYLTASMPLPATIPDLTGANPAVLRFQLSSLTPAVASLSGAVLEVEIRMVTPTEYRITNAKIAGNSTSVAIGGVHAYLKASSSATSGVGTEDGAQGTAWANLMATAAAAALPSPLPATPLSVSAFSTGSLEIQQQSTSDILTIGFDSLQ